MLLWTAKEALEVATQSPSISAPLAQGWSRVVSTPPPPLGGASFGDGSPRDGGEPPSLGGGGGGGLDNGGGVRLRVIRWVVGVPTTKGPQIMRSSSGPKSESELELELELDWESKPE